MFTHYLLIKGYGLNPGILCFFFLWISSSCSQVDIKKSSNENYSQEESIPGIMVVSY